MSIVEQAIDSIKTEESIKELCHGDVIKVASKDIPVKMDLDTTETKTEKQTNGSTSALKKNVDESTEKVENETLKKAPAVDENASKVEEMDVDASTNGNGNGVVSNEGSPKKNGKEAEDDESMEKNGKETDETSGESKTDAKIENEKKEEGAEKAESNKVDEEKNKELENSVEEAKENSVNDKVESKEDIDDKTKEEINNEDVEMKEPEDKKPVEDEKAAAESDNVVENNKEVKESENENSKVDDKNEKECEDEHSKVDDKSDTNVEDVEMLDKIKKVDEPSKETDKSTISDEVKEKEVTEDVSDKDNDKASKEVANIDVSDSNKEKLKETPSVDDNKSQEKSMSTPDEVMKCENAKNNAPSENNDQLPNVPTEESKDIKNEKIDGVKGEEEKPTENVTKSLGSISENSENDNAAMKVNNDVEKEEKEKTPPPTEKECLTRKEEISDEKGKPEQETPKENISNEDQDKSEVNGNDQEMPEVNEEDGKIAADAGTEEPKGPADTFKDDEAKSETSRMEESTAGTEKVEEEKEKETENAEELEKDDEDALHQTVYVDENRYFESGTIVELSRIAWSSGCDKQQYLRGCLWSPDGTCILTAVNMDGMHVINLPNDLYSNESTSGDRPVDKLESVINVKEGGTVYDYCWYPFMNSTMPETCCWLSSRQHCPIQLWDGFTGDLRGSYRGYDNVDEVEAAFSVTFTSDAEKIIGGYKKTLKIFDTKSPGREYSTIPIKQPCSCFAVQETQSNIIATGSWNCAINLYDLRTPKLGSLVTLEEHVGGITFLKFNASAESLYSGARKDNNLLEWDMRNFSKPLRKLNRNVKTNQRIYFDLSPGEKWLASGDTDGLIRIWDLKSEKDTEEYSFELHKDCCNGVSFHPSRPMLATCSGQYHFMESGEDGEPRQPREEVYENSLIFWWIGEMSMDKDKVDVKNQQEEKMDES